MLLFFAHRIVTWGKFFKWGYFWEPYLAFLLIFQFLLLCGFVPVHIFFMLYLSLGFLFLLFVCVFLWFGFLVAAGVLLFCRNNTSFPRISTYHFWWTKKYEGYITADWIKRVANQPSSKCKKHCKQLVELARCERVITTRAEFHFSWDYTFSAMPRFLQIWATHPPRETGCDPASPAQLCWSFSSSFSYICNTTSWKLDAVTKLI